jgi:hypothetical protein
MSIIDTTYFTGLSTKIPNNENNPSITGQSPSSSAVIASFIEKYERELMLGSMPLSTYKDLKTYAEIADPVFDEKLDSILNGKEYVYKGIDVVWDGLIQEYGTIKTSLIADYVFWHYLNQDSKHYGTVGIHRSLSKNAISLSPHQKMVEVWGLFSRSYEYGYSRYNTNISKPYYSVLESDFYENDMNVQRSLYQFLRDHDYLGSHEFVTHGTQNFASL